MAPVLGKVWSKARTVEVYFNIAEWGDGLFGIEAAAQPRGMRSPSPGNRDGSINGPVGNLSTGT